jgi:nicotinamide phosphoribosyltransferase
LKQEVIDSGATVVIRPDSGNPPEVVLKAVQILDSKFGSTVNTKGYKVLNNVKVIQGDGIDEHSIGAIIEKLVKHGYSITNVAFGMGGGLIQMLNRDTLKFAMKCSSITVNGEERDVFKDPVTDPGKASKAGRLDLVKWMNGKFSTVKLDKGQKANEFSLMRTVYESGELLVDDSLEIIRERAKENSNK